MFDDAHDYAVFPVEKQREINLLFNASTDLTLLSKEEFAQYEKEIKDYIEKTNKKPDEEDEEKQNGKEGDEEEGEDESSHSSDDDGNNDEGDEAD